MGSDKINAARQIAVHFIFCPGLGIKRGLCLALAVLSAIRWASQS